MDFELGDLEFFVLGVMMMSRMVECLEIFFIN